MRADRLAVGVGPSDLQEGGLGFLIRHAADLSNAQVAAPGGQEEVLRHRIRGFPIGYVSTNSPVVNGNPIGYGSFWVRFGRVGWAPVMSGWVGSRD